MVKADWWLVLAVASVVLGIAQAATVVVAISAASFAWVPAVAGIAFWYWIGVGAWRRWGSHPGTIDAP